MTKPVGYNALWLHYAICVLLYIRLIFEGLLCWIFYSVDLRRENRGEKWLKDRKVPQEKCSRWRCTLPSMPLSAVKSGWGWGWVWALLWQQVFRWQSQRMDQRRQWRKMKGVKWSHYSDGSPSRGAGGRAIVCHNSSRTTRDEICIFICITHSCRHLLSASRSSAQRLWGEGGIRKPSGREAFKRALGERKLHENVNLWIQCQHMCKYVHVWVNDKAVRDSLLLQMEAIKTYFSTTFYL